MTPEFGAASQLEKIDMLDFADFVAINKFDRKGAQDALRDVRKQYQRNRERFKEAPDTMPVFGTMASRFNDDGVTGLYQALAAQAGQDKGLKLGARRAAARRRRTQSTAQQRRRARGARALSRGDRGDRARLPRSGPNAQARIAREQQQLQAARRMLGDDVLEAGSKPPARSPRPRPRMARRRDHDASTRSMR